MSKLITLLIQTEVPAADKQHFYSQFGKTVRDLLDSKEFYIFFNILTSFIEWAGQTELQDLNFMLPQNLNVQRLLQNLM